MKDKLPNGWEWKMLGELGKFIRGVSYKKESLLPRKSDESITLLRANNIQDKLDLNDLQFLPKSDIKEIQKIKNKDILFCMSSGSKNLVGKNIVLDNLEGFSFGAFCSIFRSINTDYTNYLGYFLKSNEYQKQINNYSQGTNILNLRTNQLEEILLPVPPLSEQKQIVSVLDKTFEKLDQAIALVEGNIQKLKQLNESVLDEMFATKRNRFKIGDILTLKRGYDLPTQDRVNGKIPIVGANGIVGFHNEAKIIGGGVVTGRSGSIGLVHYFEDDFWALNTSLYVRDYKGNLPKYCYYLLKANSEKIKRQATYSAVPTLDRKNVQEKIFTEFHQDISEQQRIVAYLDQTTEKNQKLTQHYQNKLEALKRLKNSVLDSAFKGALKREKVIPIIQPVIDPYITRTKQLNAKKKADKQAMIIALSIEAHEKIGKSLYRTKGEKTVEVIEKHIGLEFGREAEKMAAGPADFLHLVKVVEPLAKEKKWFGTEEIKGEKFDSYKYVKYENFNPFMMRCVQELKSNLNEVRRIINLFTEIKTTHEAEVIATTYSGWNNLIIRKAQIDNETIVSEARENWHEAKLKIERQEFFDAIEWLKNNNLVPKGNGNEVN